MTYTTGLWVGAELLAIAELVTVEVVGVVWKTVLEIKLRGSRDFFLATVNSLCKIDSQISLIVRVWSSLSTVERVVTRQSNSRQRYK